MRFLKSVKGYLSYLKIKKENKNKKYIYFYSEGLNYRNYFVNVIRNLNKDKNLNILYFTSDEKDLGIIESNIKPIFIGNGLVRMFFFTNLQCELMIMTLTDLGNHEIKKSKNCKNYAYLFHSLVSTHKSYNKSSFNNYDIIFANGEYQKKELEKAEEIYDLKRKKIYKTGYSYMEFLKENFKENTSTQHVLFAPSWSKDKDNLIEKHSIDIINTVSKEKKIIFRPHPQSLIKDKKKLNLISNKFNKNEKFLYNRDIHNVEPIFNSSILITDNGGMALEYSLIFRKPVIFINYRDKIHNENYKEIKLKPIQDDFKERFGISIDTDEISNLNNIIDNALRNFKQLDTEYNKFLQEHQIIIDKPSVKITEIIKNILGKK